jgi:uncharacterized protein involved in outer membrane biogenesis
MRINWRRLTWILVAALPLAAIAGVAWLATRDLSGYQARLADQVRKTTGRELTAKVPLSVEIGTEPAMVAEGVTLTNAAWGTRPEMVHVRKLTLYFDPFALLLGELKIGRLLLEGADILVEQNEIGDINLEMLPPPDGSGPHASEHRSLRLRSAPVFPWIPAIELRNSVLTVGEGPGRPSVVLEVPRAMLGSPAANQPLQIDARLAVPRGGAPLDLTGTVGTFDGWMRSLPGNIDVQGSFGDGKIAIKGGIGVKGTNLQINSEGPDVSVFGPYIHLPVPAGGPYVLNAKAATQRSSFKVEVASLKVASSELSGEALFRVDRKGVATIAVNADVSRLDVNDLRALPAPPPPAGAPPPTQPRLMPTLPFSATWLGRSALTVSARFGEITGLGSKVQNASISLTSGATRFALRAAVTVGAGSAGFDLAYDPTGRIGHATLTANISKVSLADLSTLLGVHLGLQDAVADIDLRLRGGGRTTRDALNTASGAIDIAIAKGGWPRDPLASWPSDTQRLLGRNDPRVAFNCIAGRFEVTSGVAWLRRLVVDTPRATMVGGGYVQLRSEGWELLLVPEARDAQYATLATPLRLKGGSGRATASVLDPNVSRLIIPAGTVPSLVQQVNLAARQAGANPCAVLAPRVDGLRPGLRAQMPAPTPDRQRTGRPPSHTPAPQRRQARP